MLRLQRQAGARDPTRRMLVSATPPANEPHLGAEALLTAVANLRSELGAMALPLEVPGALAARAALRGLCDQLDDYLLPRLRELDAPLLAVVGGSTGAGKSTLVNSLLGREVTRAGVLRPTTRSPVLVHHPRDTQAFRGDRVLPSLARLTGDVGPGPSSPASSGVRLVAADALPPGLALVDAPDVDSVVETNRLLAAQLLAAADLWLFVTTAARYADAVPWDLLQTAAERGTAVAVVLNRVPPEAMTEVRTDLVAMLGANALASAPLFTIEEGTPDGGLLGPLAVQPLRSWLAMLASDSAARQVVVRRTLAGALESLSRRVPQIADAVADQAAADAGLRAEVAAAYAATDQQLGEALTDGSLLRGEVLARWQEFVGTGELFRGVQTAIGRLRDRVAAGVRGRPAPEEPLGQALHSGVAALVRSQMEAARQDSLRRWRAHPAGPDLLAGAEVDHLPADVDARLERLLRDWQGKVLELVRKEGQGRRTQARVLAFGVNALGVILMLVVFAGTAGLSGGEVVIAGGSAALAQRLLEAVFGDQAVRSLAVEAREDLLRRVEELLAEQRQQLLSRLDDIGVDAAAASRLRTAAAAVQAAR